MPKYQSVLNEEAKRGKRSRAPAVVVFLALALISPVLFEGGAVLVAKWQTMAGTYRVARTPVLDALGDWTRGADSDVRLRFSQAFVSGAWSPTSLVPIGMAWAALMAVVFLRKTH